MEHFKIDDATWETLCSQASRQKVTALDVALDMGLLNENKLLEWERNTTGFLTLKFTFFNGQHPEALWTQYDFSECRATCCMPVGQWEGHTYWAKLCSESTGFEGKDPQAIWVLAPWTGMKKWFGLWEAMKSSDLDSEVDIVIHDETTEMTSPADNLVTEPATPPTDSPVGLGDVSHAAIDKISFDSLSMVPDVPKAPAQSRKSPPPTLPSTPPPVPEDSVTKSFTMTEENLPPPIPIKSAAPPPAAPSGSPGQPLISAQPVPLDQLNSRMQMALTQDELIATLLGGWLNYFEKTMIFLLQSEKLLIWKCAGSWNPIGGSEMIPLDTASIFKIVADTQKPYHGYIMPGLVNDHFFAKTTGGIRPEHVTVVPLVTDKRVVGMLYGSCSKDQGKKIVLRKLEENAEYFSSALLKLLPGAKKAS